jgi:hypothetical protein
MPISAYIQTVAFMVLACLTLFVSAGTLAFATYWVYLAIFAVGFVTTFLLLDPDLARERMRPAGKRPPLALWGFTGVLFAHWIVAGLDHGRFHWSDTVPTWLNGSGSLPWPRVTRSACGRCASTGFFLRWSAFKAIAAKW